MKQFHERNLSMVMDFYEMTMSNGYFRDQDKDTKVAFDVFYRKNPDNGGFSIFCGLEQIVEYIENLHFDREDIEYLRGQRLFGEEFWNICRNFGLKGMCTPFRRGPLCTPTNPLLPWLRP